MSVEPKARKAAPGLVAVRLHLTPNERDRLRSIAADDGTDMARWVRAFVRAEIDRRKPAP